MDACCSFLLVEVFQETAGFSTFSCPNRAFFCGLRPERHYSRKKINKSSLRNSDKNQRLDRRSSGLPLILQKTLFLPKSGHDLLALSDHANAEIEPEQRLERVDPERLKHLEQHPRKGN